FAHEEKLALANQSGMPPAQAARRINRAEIDLRIDAGPRIRPTDEKLVERRIEREHAALAMLQRTPAAQFRDRWRCPRWLDRGTRRRRFRARRLLEGFIRCRRRGAPGVSKRGTGRLALLRRFEQGGGQTQLALL